MVHVAISHYHHRVVMEVLPPLLQVLVISLPQLFTGMCIRCFWQHRNWEGCITPCTYAQQLLENGYSVVLQRQRSLHLSIQSIQKFLA